MKRKIAFIALSIITPLIFAQKSSQDFYIEDESFHKNEINKFIEANKKEYENLFYASSLNYAYNKTIFLLLDKGELKVYSLENKKFKQKIRCKKIKLKEKEKKSLIELINNNSNFNPIINIEDCSLDDTIHHYRIEFFLNGRKYQTSSKCLNVISNIKILDRLMSLLDK